MSFEARIPALGDSIPDFEVNDDTGTLQTPHSLMGASGLLLVFLTGTWCPPCVKTLVSLARNVRRFEELGVKVAVITIDDATALQNFKRTASIPFNYAMLADKDETVRAAFDVFGEEVYLLLDPNLTVKARFVDPEGTNPPGPQALEAAIVANLKANSAS